MSRLLVIGCGGVAQVAISKCCQNSKTFTELCIASRTKSKCDALKEKLQPKTDTVITTAKVNADSKDELVALIKEYKPDAVLNVALPYQDLTIMDACLECKVDYIDTANYEPEDTDDPEWRAIYEKRCKEKGFTAYFDYSWQWAYQDRFKEAGITGLLGSGFDPGVTSVFSAYALKHYFDGVADPNSTDVQLKPFVTNAYGDLVDSLDALYADETSGAIGHYVGCLIPYFKNKQGQYASLDIVFNNDSDAHNMMMSFNVDLLEEDGIANIDLSGRLSITDSMVNDLFNGEGIFINSNGDISKGVFKDGEFIKQLDNLK